MLAQFLIATLFAALVQSGDSLERSGASNRDLEKSAKPVQAYFAALGEDDRGAQVEELNKLQDALEKTFKKARGDKDPTFYLGDWDALLELSKPESRDMKKVIGKGFVPYAFEEPYDGSRVVALLSVPKDYGKTDGFLPVIVALKPELGLGGRELVEAVTAQAQLLYAGLAEDHIVLIPLGPESGSGRSAEVAEVEDGWLTDAGLYAFFTSYRILLEQLQFDRSRVVLDGWGDAGLQAMKLATSVPSFFAGLINRGGDAMQDGLLLENLYGQSLLYIKDAGASSRELGAIESAGIEGVGVKVLETKGLALEPDAALTGSVSEWLGGVRKNLAPTEIRYKLGDIRFQAVNWCKASVINKRATARPDDSDFPRIHATIDRGRNSITFDTVNVLEMQVYLSDALVDMSKPVVIKVNGEEKWKGTPKPSARTLLDNRYYNDSGDYGLYTDRVLLDEIAPNVPGRDG